MAKAKRAGISKKTRFEVFKRDSFSCQYCGRSAPESILRVDHIHPVSKGGEDDILNLITSCFDCNAGKGDRTLGDDASIQRQRAQLEELNERREQLEMLVRWRDGMRDLNDQALDAFTNAWDEMCLGWHLNEVGRNNAQKLLKKHGLKKCLDAIDIAHNYIAVDDAGKASPESAQLAFSKLGGILAMQDRPEAERKMYYIKGILRNRFRYVDHRESMRLMREVVALGGDVGYIERQAKECWSWSNWASDMAGYVSDLQNGEGE